LLLTGSYSLNNGYKDVDISNLTIDTVTFSNPSGTIAMDYGTPIDGFGVLLAYSGLTIQIKACDDESYASTPT